MRRGKDSTPTTTAPAASPEAAVNTAPTATAWAPDRTRAEAQWHGTPGRRPWDYACEVAIPVLDTPDTLPLVIELLRRQTARPFIVLIDTGSTPASHARIEALRAPDVEVHSLRLHAVRHPSDFVAIAMDLAMSLCRTEHLFCTHADCFLTSRTVLAELIARCTAKNPAVGYQLTERAHSDWSRMVSHTCTMLHMPVMDRIGAGWSLRRLCTLRDVPHHPNILGANWPDTEILLNYLLWDHGYQADLIGTERNHARNTDARIDHVRSVTAGRLYSPAYAAQAEQWLAGAMNDARTRLHTWGAAA